MKHIKKPVFLLLGACLVFLAVAFTSFSSPPSLAKEEKKLQKAPVNPEFERYFALKKMGRLQMDAPEKHALGLIPSPYKPEKNAEAVNDSLEKKKVSGEEFAASYDLRTLGKVSSVKDQGTCGSCWAFATMGSLESHWLVLGESESNLSENNLNECHNFEWVPCDGGNRDMASSYLSKNQGPMSEADDPYQAESGSCHTGLYPVAYAADARFLPKDSDVIKQYLIDYGALYTTMRWENASYNSSDYTYYYSGAGDGNHAITLVGWDDNKVTAGGTGAWILKNSWAADWGDGGYFYVSYADTKINEDVTAWTSKIDYTNAKTIYMYDEIGMINAYGWSDETDYGLTKFTATGNQQITKVGTWITHNGSSVSFDVYDDFDGTTLSNVLGSLHGQSADYYGYHTFDLSSPISISNGDDFFVKVTYNTPGYNFPIPAEEAYVDYADPTIETGKNWVSDTGSNGSWDAVGTGTADLIDLDIRVYALSTENVSTPSASPAAGTYNTYQSVTLSTATAGASIYYTTNGSTPTTSSTRYTGAISVSQNTTVKAIAVKAGMTNSAVASAAYVINLLQVSTPSASPVAGTYSSAQSVTLSTSTSGATIYYTTNGSTPTTSSTRYTGAISVSQNTTVKAIAVKAGMTNSAVASAAYVIQAAVPSASPTGGSYNSFQSVTLSTATSGATIHYTTDGSTPTASSASYSSGLSISTDTTVKAISVKSGMADSTAMTEAYVIKVNTDTPTLGYSTSKKAKRKINLTFKDLALTKKKWVRVSLNGRKVKVQSVRRSGNNSIVRIYFSFRKWSVGNYSSTMTYKNQTKVPYTTSKGKTKYRKGWDSGSVISEKILTII